MVNKLKTCRCCLTESKAESELYEFSSEVSVDSETLSEPQNFVKISECYKQLTSITIPEETEDVSKICSQCLGDLKFCYMFQQKCWDAEKVYSEKIDEEELFTIETLEENIKIEREAANCSVSEYVEEEYIEEVNDEDTDDGYENEEVDLSNEHEEEKLKPAAEGRREGTTLSCELCPKVFDRKDTYRRHFRRSHLTHAIEETADRLTDEGKDSEISQLQLYQCSMCGKISVSKDEHETHMIEHGAAQYKCKKCDEKFSSKDEARDHLNAAHTNEEKCFVCETCEKGFKNRYQLILHNRSHTGEKPFECPVCNRCFSMSSNLQKHLDTHSTEKPYPCNVCGQFFKTQRSLKFHTVCYHQPEAKVKCQTCDKSFVNKSYLKMHMLYHTGEKNFTCTICNSKYYKSSHLKRHIQNVHFKLRLMKCDFCASDFVRKETYRAHITSHHKRQLTDREYQDVLDKIKKFQPPSLDIKQFTLEKQNEPYVQQVMENEEVSEDYTMEVIEEDSADDDGMMNQPDIDYYGECELLKDEQ